MAPTHGYIQHFSHVPDGSRWPELRMRVFGMSSPRDSVRAVLRADGTWWDVPADECRGSCFSVPPECTLTQGQVGDAIAAAGIANALPFEAPDRFTHGALIVYESARARPVQPSPAPWAPTPPKWRGGKPWR